MPMSCHPSNAPKTSMGSETRMKTFAILLALAIGGATVLTMQATRLEASSACYSILAGDRPIGIAAAI